MSSTLRQSSLNFTNVLNENDNTTKSSSNNTVQFVIKNINNLPRNELEEFLKVYIYFRKIYLFFIYI
jgi:hypothetical protein